MAHPRNAIDDSVQRSGSTAEHGGGASRAQKYERRRLRGQTFAFEHLNDHCGWSWCCGDNQNSRTREESVCQSSSGTINRPVLGHKDVTPQRQRRLRF